MYYLNKLREEVGDDLSVFLVDPKSCVKTLPTLSVFSFITLVWLENFFESVQN